MIKKLVIVLLFLFIVGCNKETIIVPYFNEFHFCFSIKTTSIYEQDMIIKSGKDFIIILSSQGDSTINMPTVHDTIKGMITEHQMDSLINYCRLADVYNVKFSNNLSENDSVICEVMTDFIYSIEVEGDNGNYNKLYYTYCFIPKAAYELKDYALKLLNIYLSGK